MKKAKTDELARPDWSKAERGRSAKRGLRTSRAVLIAPELYAEFGSDDAVREAPEALVKVRTLLAPTVKRGRRAA